MGVRFALVVCVRRETAPAFCVYICDKKNKKMVGYETTGVVILSTVVFERLCSVVLLFWFSCSVFSIICVTYIL